MLSQKISYTEIAEAKRMFEQCRNVVIVSHVSADGDAIGSSLGMYEYMKKKGKQATVIVPNYYPDFLKWMTAADRIILYDRHRAMAKTYITAADLIVVLDLFRKGKKSVGFFPCTGMHGGKMYLRSDCKGIHFPHQVHTRPADSADLDDIAHYLRRFCYYFGHKLEELLDHPFTVVTPDSSNPYRQMYVAN